MQNSMFFNNAIEENLGCLVKSSLYGRKVILPYGLEILNQFCPFSDPSIPYTSSCNEISHTIPGDPSSVRSFSFYTACYRYLKWPLIW